MMVASKRNGHVAREPQEAPEEAPEPQEPQGDDKANIRVLEEEVTSLRESIARHLQEVKDRDQRIEEMNRELQISQAQELKAWRKLEEARDKFYSLASEVQQMQDGTHPALQGKSPEGG